MAELVGILGIIFALSIALSMICYTKPEGGEARFFLFISIFSLIGLIASIVILFLLVWFPKIS